MRILLVSEFFLSGQSTHVLELAQQLQKLDHTVEIVFTKIHTPLFFSYYGPKLEEQGIKYHYTNRRQDIAKVITTLKPDIIHAHSSTIFDSTMKLATKAGIPFVVT